MIKRIEILFITIIITGVLFISGCGRVAVPEYSSSDVMLEAFDEYCMTYNISNAEVRLVDGTGETLWDARYGESEGDRLFAVASITKMFTAAVIFNLDEESLLSLDDCIDSYLPDGIVDGIAVIIRMKLPSASFCRTHRALRIISVKIQMNIYQFVRKATTRMMYYMILTLLWI